MGFGKPGYLRFERRGQRCRSPVRRQCRNPRRPPGGVGPCARVIFGKILDNQWPAVTLEQLQGREDDPLLEGGIARRAERPPQLERHPQGAWRPGIPTISRSKSASELFSSSVRRLIISSVIVGSLVRVTVQRPNPTEDPRRPPLWISSPPPPDSWRSLPQATYPQLLHHPKGHDPGHGRL